MAAAPQQETRNLATSRTPHRLPEREQTMVVVVFACLRLNNLYQKNIFTVPSTHKNKFGLLQSMIYID